MNRRTFRGVLKAIHSYLVFFFMVAFLITCCMMLFASTLADTIGLVFNAENITAAAKVTFLNVLLLTFLFSAIDCIRRKMMVDRPVKMITDATQKIMQGDFSVRIQPMQGSGMEGFHQIAQAINQMAEELSGTETLRTDFIANVSHELKTPLAVMGNYATMLQHPGISPEERCEYAKAISETARKLAQLVTNILKLNKLENQQIYPKPQEFDLGEQLCESLLGFEAAWEAKNLAIETEIEEDIWIQSDPELLRLVWNNLISNAVKFTPDGGKIGVSLKTEGNTVVVSVSDTGCGMTPEVGRHIFEKFYQGDASHATQGNGLGLALVKRVVDILGGEIRVQSTYCQGSTFTVRIKRG